MTYEIGHISRAIFFSFTISMSLGCFAIEYLDCLDLRLGQSDSDVDLPMPDALRAEQDSVIQVHIGGRAVPKRLARMEDEWDIQPELLLSFHEPPERAHVVREGIEGVFVPHQVEAFPHPNPSQTRCDGNRNMETRVSPQIKCGNSCFSARQSSRHHSSSSGVQLRKAL